jgi:hypothetical protein
MKKKKKIENKPGAVRTYFFGRTRVTNLCFAMRIAYLKKDKKKKKERGFNNRKKRKRARYKSSGRFADWMTFTIFCFQAAVKRRQWTEFNKKAKSWSMRDIKLSKNLSAPKKSEFFFFFEDESKKENRREKYKQTSQKTAEIKVGSFFKNLVDARSENGNHL